MMGGEIDWSALPWMAFMLGADDIETISELLIAMRERRAMLDKD